MEERSVFTMIAYWGIKGVAYDGRGVFVVFGRQYE
jgi:hypothetical protein